MDACVGIQLEHVVLETIHPNTGLRCKDQTCRLLMFVFQAQPLHARGCKAILLMGGQTRNSNEQWGIDIVTAMGSSGFKTQTSFKEDGLFRSTSWKVKKI
jgi:hypothetical protein